MRFSFSILYAVLVTMIVALFTSAQNHPNSQAQTPCMSDTEVGAALGKFDALSKMPPNQKLRETLIFDLRH